jgi:hypothetical protein
MNIGIPKTTFQNVMRRFLENESNRSVHKLCSVILCSKAHCLFPQTTHPIVERPRVDTIDQVIPRRTTVESVIRLTIRIDRCDRTSTNLSEKPQPDSQKNLRNFSTWWYLLSRIWCNYDILSLGISSPLLLLFTVLSKNSPSQKAASLISTLDKKSNLEE